MAEFAISGGCEQALSAVARPAVPARASSCRRLNGLSNTPPDLAAPRARMPATIRRPMRLRCDFYRIATGAGTIPRGLPVQLQSNESVVSSRIEVGCCSR